MSSSKSAAKCSINLSTPILSELWPDSLWDPGEPTAMQARTPLLGQGSLKTLNEVVRSRVQAICSIWTGKLGTKSNLPLLPLPRDASYYPLVISHGNGKSSFLMGKLTI